MRRLPLRSPPRVRGKDPPAAAMQGCPGITPACAGKSHSVTDANASSWDHPRVCGEKSTSEAQKSSDMGSPPRMRGKGSNDHQRTATGRITPAYAGKSFEVLRRLTNERDHPRVCGEKPPRYSGICTVLGSPPRMRGKVIPVHSRSSPPRITPACAGKRRI